MNTKQVEELVGISRQNIRYYEKEGLLTPCREKQNSYRNYSEEDVERLKMIKMLRMLDMPLNDIAQILNNEMPLQEAVAVRRSELLERQKQLQAAIDICNLIRKEKTEEIDVDKYLNKMEHMERNGNAFAKIIDDYKRVIRAEEEKQIVFYTDNKINASADFEKILKEYAKGQNLKFKIKEKGKYPKFYLNDELYCAVYSFRNPGYQIVCKKIEDSKAENSAVVKLHSMITNIRRHSIKSICCFVISFMLVLLFGIYMGNLNQIHAQIEKLPESMPVYAAVYNNKGNCKNHLLIRKEIVEGIRESKHAVFVKETVELVAKGTEGEHYRVLALEDDEMESIQHGQCFVSPVFLENNHLEIGDKIQFSIFCFKSDLILQQLSEHFIADVEFEIIGTREIEEDIQIPLRHAKSLFEETGNTYHASSLSFQIKEPEMLNDLKWEMKELGLQPIQSEAEEYYYGSALGIEDGAFIKASIKLENDKILLQRFLPVVLLLLLIAEYLVSYLLLQSRRQEFAIMRALGKSKKECSRGLIAEQMILVVLGIILGSVICCLTMNMKGPVFFVIIAIFFLIALLGIYSAVWMLGRFRVSAVLTCRD